MKTILFVLIMITAQMSFAEDCIIVSRIRNYNAVDEHTVEIDAGNDYVMDLSYCSQLMWSHKIGFDTFGSMRVCRGDKLLVIDDFSNHIIESCFIESIVKTK